MQPFAARLRGLYAITPDAMDPEMLVTHCAAIVAAGAVLLQYRASDGHDPELARQLRVHCRATGCRLIINDDLDLAARIGADGVHLGRDDAPIAEARRILGPAAIIGASCYDSLALAEAARDAGASYLAFGSVAASSTKPDAVRAPLTLLAEARGLDLPVVAIGGITLAVAPTMIAAGADLLAVISDLFHHPDPAAQAAAYVACFDT